MRVHASHSPEGSLLNVLSQPHLHRPICTLQSTPAFAAQHAPPLALCPVSGADEFKFIFSTKLSRYYLGAVKKRCEQQICALPISREALARPLPSAHDPQPARPRSAHPRAAVRLRVRSLHGASFSHPHPIPSPLLLSHLRAQSAWLPLFPSSASRRALEPAHLPTSSTPPPRCHRLLRLPSPGPCHCPFSPSRRLRRSQPQPAPSSRVPVVHAWNPSASPPSASQHPPLSARSHSPGSTLPHRDDLLLIIPACPSFVSCAPAVLFLLRSLPPCSALHPTPSADLLPFAADDDLWAEGSQDGRECRLLCIADAVLAGGGRNMGRKCQIAWVFFNTN